MEVEGREAISCMAWTLFNHAEKLFWRGHETENEIFILKTHTRLGMVLTTHRTVLVQIVEVFREVCERNNHYLHPEGLFFFRKNNRNIHIRGLLTRTESSQPKRPAMVVM
jgi:hypothetical protein